MDNQTQKLLNRATKGLADSKKAVKLAEALKVDIKKAKGSK